MSALNYTCCTLNFNSLKEYVKHLKVHQNKRDLLMECNVCGQTSRGWNQFKKHYRKSHKEMKQILEMCENEYDEPIENIIIDETNEGLKLILRKAYF